ncbi:MAG: septum formation initiator family protein [Firmicutes bacterium]|nr:septum formation initiator family protein [Bacillota bacterium]
MKRLTNPRRFATALLVGLLLVVGVGFVHRHLRVKQVEAEIRRVQAEIQAVQARNQRLQELIDYMNSPEYVEKVAREKLRLVMPGETVYKIAEPQDFPAPYDIPQTNPKP